MSRPAKWTLALALFLPWAWPQAKHLLQRVPEDFLYYYTGADLYRSGRDPYDKAVYQGALEARLGRPNPFPSKDFPFLYPPLFGRLIEPLAALPIATAYGLWTAVVGLSILVFWRLESGGLPGPESVLLGAFLLAYPGAEAATFMHRVTWPLLAALWAGLLLAGRGRDAAGGLLVGLSAVQPPWGAVAALCLAAGRRWRALAWAAVPTALSLAPYVVGARPWTELAHYAAASHAAGSLTSLGGLSVASCVERLVDPRWSAAVTFLPAPGWERVLAAALGASYLAAAAWVWAGPGDWLDKAAWSFAFAVAVQPYSGSSDTLWMFPWLASGLRRRWPSERAFYRALAGAVAATFVLRRALDSTLGHGWIGLAYLAGGAGAFLSGGAGPREALVGTSRSAKSARTQ